MEFKNDKAIYLQIADYVCDRILYKVWKAGDRIPSVREIGALLEVNPNTVLHTFAALQNENIIVNKRGVGFFLTDECFNKAYEMRKKEFLTLVLPNVFETMQSLNIPMGEVSDLFNKYVENQKK